MHEYMTLAAAGAALPKPKSAGTLLDWSRRGLLGGTVKLETVKFGGTVCVDKRSLDDFFMRLTVARAAKRAARVDSPPPR